jgi:hypothetical protein
MTCDQQEYRRTRRHLEYLVIVVVVMVVVVVLSSTLNEPGNTAAVNYSTKRVPLAAHSTQQQQPY